MNGALEFIALANIALLASFVAAWLIERLIRHTRFRHAYRLRLNLAIAALIAASLPIVLAPVTHALSSQLQLNATDLLVSHYLKGNIGVTALQLTDALDAKDRFLENLVGATSTLSFGILIAFGIAALIRTAYILFNLLRVRRLIAGGRVIRRTRRVDIITSDRITIPFSTRGLLRYAIVLPESLLKDRRSTAIVLGHEAQHIRQHDVDWEIVLSLVSPLFILNPAFLFLCDRIRRFREYSCDAALIENNRVDAKEYCLLLLRVASNATKAAKGRRGHTLSTSVPFFGRETFARRAGNTALRQRVMAMTTTTPALRGPLRFLNAVPAIALAALMTVAVLVLSKPADWSHDRIMLSTVANLERLDRINGFGVRPLR